jgi:hypothetical protein
VKLPSLRPELAKTLVAAFTSAYPGKSIPLAPTEVSTGASALVLTSPTNGATVSRDTDVIGSVQPGNLDRWRLEFGPGGNPSEWQELGSGTTTQDNQPLGRIEIDGLEEGVYTLRLTARDRLLGELSASVTINVRQGGPDGDDDDDDDGNGDGDGPPDRTRTPRPGQTPPPGNASHPIGYEECGPDPSCGGGIIVVRCGPLGWFVDVPRTGQDFGDRDWPVFVVQSASEAPTRAAVVCNP